MAHPTELEPVDTYGPDGIPESIVMFKAGLEEVPEIASRNMHMGFVTEPQIIYEAPVVEIDLPQIK